MCFLRISPCDVVTGDYLGSLISFIWEQSLLLKETLQEISMHMCAYGLPNLIGLVGTQLRVVVGKVSVCVQLYGVCCVTARASGLMRSGHVTSRAPILPQVIDYII